MLVYDQKVNVAEREIASVECWMLSSSDEEHLRLSVVRYLILISLRKCSKNGREITGDRIINPDIVLNCEKWQAQRRAIQEFDEFVSKMKTL